MDGRQSVVDNSSLPQEHEDQMQLGLRIITSAFQNKMHVLQHEISGLRITCDEQRTSVASVQKKNSALEVELVEIHQRSQQLAEENKELFKTVHSLRKQIGRLEHLKAAVLSSIDDHHALEAETGESRALTSDEYVRGSTPLTAGALGYPTSSSQSGPRALGPPAQMVPPAQALPPAQMHHQVASSPPASAMVGAQRDAQNLSPRQSHLGYAGQDHSAYGQSPRDVQVNSVDSYGQGSGAIGGAAPVIDGKQFFRQARSRLSYESFNLFLGSIKRLNNQQQSREETLEEARGIFGVELQDLYQDFENLLNRQGM